MLPRFGRQADRVLYKIGEMYDRGLQRFRERRFYYRTMDFDGPGWNTVREAAEPYRAKASQIFDESALAEVLPRPGVRAVVPDAIIDTAKMKCMVGLLLWLRSYA